MHTYRIDSLRSQTIYTQARTHITHPHTHTTQTHPTTLHLNARAPPHNQDAAPDNRARAFSVDSANGDMDAYGLTVSHHTEEGDSFVFTIENGQLIQVSQGRSLYGYLSDKGQKCTQNETLLRRPSLKFLHNQPHSWAPPSLQGEGTGGVWYPHEGLYVQMSIFK